MSNWVQQQGGLPPWIKRAAEHLQSKGHDESRAIAMAVAAAKRYCASGHLTSDLPAEHFDPASRAEACAAVAEWERMRAAAHAESRALSDLPEYVQEIAAGIMRDRAYPPEKAANIAIAACREFCSTGHSPNLRGVEVGPDTRAKACAAVAELDAAGKPEPPSEKPAKPEPPSRPDTTEPPVSAEPLPPPESYSAAEWERACVVDRGPEVEDTRERFAVPVRLPSGEVSREGLNDAAALLEALKVKPSILAAAARGLLALFRRLALVPPKVLIAMAEEARSMPEIEERTVSVDVAELEARGRTVVGYAAIFDTLSHDLGGFRERIAPGAFSEVLASDPDVRALLNHDPSQVLGRTRSGTLRLSEDERGLRFELDLPESRADVREAVARGDLDGASFRFKVGPGGQTWQGDTRTLTRIDSLLDASLATYGAYEGAGVVELRTRESEGSAVGEVEEVVEETTEQNEETEERTQGSGGSLRVEDRVERGAESRSLHDMFKRGGFSAESRGSISFEELMGSDEQRALTIDSPTTAADIAPIRRDGVPLGSDQRYLFPVIPTVGVDAGTTSISVLRQTSRTLPDPADVVRVLASDQPKAETGSNVRVESLPMLGVAAVQQQIPNIWIEHPAIRTVIGQDLRLSINEALDSLVLDALAAAGFQPPGSDALLVSIRKAISTVQAEGYNPDTVVLRPADSEALDVLTTSGPEEAYVFGAARFAPGQLFGLSVRVSKSAAAPVVLDSQAVGRLYVSPLSLARFEEANGTTNCSTLRLEGSAQFGAERIAAAVRIAAS